MKKGILVSVFILLHLVVTRFAVRIIDATVGIDGNYLALVASLLIINFVLYLLFSKIYNILIRKK